MAVQLICDCCGKPLSTRRFYVLNVTSAKMSHNIRVMDGLYNSGVNNQELCDDCTLEICENYRLKKASKMGITIKRICANCKVENNNDMFCPCCGCKDWNLVEGGSTNVI